MCDLPTPVRPIKSTFSLRSTKAHVARSMILAFGISGLKWKSKSSASARLEVRSTDARLELLGVAALDLVREKAIQKLAVVDVVVDGLARAQLERLQHAGQTQFLE
jgi:hypothetical protein